MSPLCVACSDSSEVLEEISSVGVELLKNDVGRRGCRCPDGLAENPQVVTCHLFRKGFQKYESLAGSGGV